MKEIKEKRVVVALDSTLSTLLKIIQAIKVALHVLEEPLLFELFQIFIKYVENKYGYFRYNQMQYIKDF